MTARTCRKKLPVLTAHIGYQPADPSARRRRDRYHAVTDQPVPLGPLTRDPGQALCGLTGPWPEPPAGLFPPLVTCPACRALADTNHVTITETS
ncbi:MAG: hypothetical protein ACR2FU_02110 [Streptosporangiaceae bacterium]